ncbi:VQ motif-containing protein 31 [Elaeis guineensis]|uniref:VQ motif-containing protein 31 n=1 Tax=Elaeis guineensis var. tenera TaxID=51953 RepID=A0A6I9RPX2_ELAGV|nr:VQ motif-containing protein 31 [Elaeis guineensis]XP_010930538.1 VQ motif-containing protein 31 [Elaeis guineensis]XP_010930539.1 VQ motif-containing protein 31 [Elaeis guineensis]XP_010930540.1 VQ motif-containing protein 31 [Elaeis guineensis]
MEKAPGLGPQAPVPSTTFVQTDATTFKELVQRLTGPHDEPNRPLTPVPPTDPNSGPAQLPKGLPGVKRPTFKLHERRQGIRSKLTITKPGSYPQLADLCLQAGPAVVSPSSSTPGFPLSPLISPSSSFADLHVGEEGTGPDELNREAEERAIKERRFYLHPSPRSRPGNAEPELLPLFPVTSPKPPGP